MCKNHLSCFVTSAFLLLGGGANHTNLQTPLITGRIYYSKTTWWLVSRLNLKPFFWNADFLWEPSIYSANVSNTKKHLQSLNYASLHIWGTVNTWHWHLGICTNHQSGDCLWTMRQRTWDEDSWMVKKFKFKTEPVISIFACCLFT